MKFKWLLPSDTKSSSDIHLVWSVKRVLIYGPSFSFPYQLQHHHLLLATYSRIALSEADILIYTILAIKCDTKSNPLETENREVSGTGEWRFCNSLLKLNSSRAFHVLTLSVQFSSALLSATQMEIIFRGKIKSQGTEILSASPILMVCSCLYKLQLQTFCFFCGINRRKTLEKVLLR